jgi:NAD(P)-dependent dehydrogenase (short-subunit alcohol dehydrogenase family)
MENTHTLMVTGTAKGIGRAIAEHFLAQGWRVVGTASSPETHAQLARELPQAHIRVVDMAQKHEVKALAEWVLATHGTPHVLVNNAGRFLPGALLQEPDEYFELQLALNLAGPYYLTKGIVPAMVARGSGTVVNICSTASLRAYPNGGSYGVSKHALLGFTRNLREELKPTGVRVVGVYPGPTLTASWAGTDLPPQRFMAPADIAAAVWMACALPPTTVVEDIVLRPQLGDI